LLLLIVFVGGSVKTSTGLPVLIAGPPDETVSECRDVVVEVFPEVDKTVWRESPGFSTAPTTGANLSDEGFPPGVHRFK
jgi:hypothetical protein